MFGLLKEVKKSEEISLNWREDSALVEAQNQMAALKEKRSVLEQSLQKAVSIEAESYTAFDAAVTEHLINKISDKELAGIDKGYKEAQANTVRIRGLLQEHDALSNRLQRGIDILTADAKETASKNIIAEYKKTIAELAEKLNEVSLINEEVKQLHDMTSGYQYDEIAKLFHTHWTVSGLPNCYWKELRITGDVNATELSKWLKDVKEYGFID